MKEVVAKRYVKALTAGLNSDECEAFLLNLKALTSAFSQAKFKHIISFSGIKSEEKAEFLLSLCENPSLKFKNFINLLAQKGRLGLIPEIYNELNAKTALLQNLYFGEIYANKDLSDEQVLNLQAKFSQKFGANIKLQRAGKEYNGIKIELDDLGVQMSFSADKLKAQMSEFILKAI